MFESMKLILFDIDGTLVHVDHAVTTGAIREVVRKGLGYEGDPGEIELHGKTDRQILRELCVALGCPTNEIAERCRVMEEVLLDQWQRNLHTGTVTLLPGVRDLLDALAECDDVHLGLLTGNVEPAARMKLAPHDLNRFFPHGSFGSDSDDRNQLPPIAVARAEAHSGLHFPWDRVLIIGDSHRDIACARAWGINALAVATGVLTLEDLLGYAPDAACSSLIETDYIFEFISRA
jgi:phosphoglycolate phosphatase